MFHVTAFPDSISEYVSQIYAGLYELSAMGAIKLSLSDRFFHNTRKTNKHCFCTLFLEVKNSETDVCRNLCFDMIDGHNLVMDDLHQTDRYFKRSYHQPLINKLPAELRKKVLPYGLQYSCRSNHETPLMIMRHRFLHHSIHQNLLSSPVRVIRQTLGHPLKMIALKWMPTRLSFGLPSLIEDFEAVPGKPAEKKIFFRTRVYELNGETPLDHRDEINEVNEMRVNTIRALKKNFRNLFVGGLRHSTYAHRLYSDCIFNDNINASQHIQYSKRFLINVTTRGLWGSVGWKLPEFIASSRCIVSEPLKVNLPVPLEEGKHYLAFNSPSQCVEACENTK